jgi:quercetin dioxygenase-like cupin family protein
VRGGEVYENRIQGDRFVVREGSQDASGERLVGDLYIRPGGAVAGKHVHSYITERFEVLAGTVRFHLDGRDEIAAPGQKVEVPPGVHDWWNVGDDEAHVLVDIRPAERFELMIQNLYGLANDGKAKREGRAEAAAACAFLPGVPQRGRVRSPAADRPAAPLRRTGAAGPGAWLQSDQPGVPGAHRKGSRPAGS